MATRLPDMAGLSNALLISRTAAGQLGSAGRWPATGRRIAGVATQSRGGPYSAGNAAVSQSLLSIVNVTLVNYTLSGGGQTLFAFEPCGRCQVFQGGATTSMAGLRFVQPGLPALASWSWAHQVGWLCVCTALAWRGVAWVKAFASLYISMTSMTAAGS